MLRYFDHVLPLRPGTARLPLRDLLEAQHYRLTWWRDAATELNWRRFFDIATLIGVRVEDPAVFDATHEVIVRLVAEGLVDGLRVDHPDGLADPRGYLRRLADGDRRRLGRGGEDPRAAARRCRPTGPCAGTTGYDALRVVDGLFLDPAAGDALGAEYTRFCRMSGDDCPARRFADVAAEAKREIADGAAARRGAAAGRLLRGVCPAPETPAEDAHAVLTEVLAAFPVYRAYVHPGEPPPRRVGAAMEARGWRAPAPAAAAARPRRRSRRGRTRPAAAGERRRPGRASSSCGSSRRPGRCRPRASRTPRATAGRGWSR